MKAEVYFGVFEFDFDHDLITKLSGMEPIEDWNKGENYHDEFPTAVRTHRSWVLGSGHPPDTEIEIPLNALMERRTDNLASLGKVISLYKCRIVIAQDIGGGCVIFDISSQFIRRIPDLNSEIWIDQN